MSDTFGSFIHDKRVEKKISLKELGGALKFSATYILDVEKGRRAPLVGDKLKTVCEILSLTEDEKLHLYDLAGIERHTVPADVTDYLLSHPEEISKIREKMR